MKDEDDFEEGEKTKERGFGGSAATSWSIGYLFMITLFRYGWRGCIVGC